MASVAAEAFCEKYASTDDSHIKQNPEFYLEHTIPYLTVRTLHTTRDTLARHEKALKSLEADSRWIKWFAIITGVDRRVILPDNRLSDICWAVGCGDELTPLSQRIASANANAIRDAARRNVHTLN